MSVPIDLDKIKVVNLSKVYDLSKFDCGVSDLNEFIQKDAFEYEEQRLARTFLLIYDNNVLIGFFSLVNDAIRLDDDEKEEDGLDCPMHEFPATKIARFAVQKEYQGKKVGSTMLMMAVGYILDSKYSASRFVTVDSYPDKVSWYERFKFVRNLNKKYTNKDDYVSMRYDLMNPPKANATLTGL
ncbi:MAG: GNAT family N-acetyltransferase [Candidatus Woesearchaeota archaeon]